MTEKRYFNVEWYLFDSTTISEQLVKEQAEYGYGVFANSLSPSEIVDLLNDFSEENKKLNEEWEFSFRTELAHHRVAEKELKEKIRKQQATITELKEANNQLKSYKLYGDNKRLQTIIADLKKENEQLKSQLYCDDEEGVCNICKHHYLAKDNEIELGYYNSRCQKGHYECARVSLKHCEDFEKELFDDE